MAPADPSQLIAAARFAPRDQSAGTGRPHKPKFFGRRAREILKIVTATEMPQHGVDRVCTVTHDRRPAICWNVTSRRIVVGYYYHYSYAIVTLVGSLDQHRAD